MALLPLLAGAGHFAEASSAFLLFLTNVICINLAGVVTFLIQGVSSRAWREADRAQKATRKVLKWLRSSQSRDFAN